jgi:hypothetical protein
VKAVPGRCLNLTKAQAASRQVDAAIDALDRGDFDVAVTLASAAEDMIDREGLTLLAFLMSHSHTWMRRNGEAL